MHGFSERPVFNDLSALTAELETRIAAADMTVAEYERFNEELNTSADLRSAVAQEYERYCLE